MKLNWEKPKGIICGPPPVSGAKYEQGGRYFNVSGDEVGVIKNQKQEEAVAEPVAPDPTINEAPAPQQEAEVKPDEPNVETPEDELKLNIMILLKAGKAPKEIGLELGVPWQKVVAVQRGMNK